jgi:hypothetical protein
LGPKKIEILGPTPFNGPSNGFARIKIIKSKRQICSVKISEGERQKNKFSIPEMKKSWGEGEGVAG